MADFLRSQHPRKSERGGMRKRITARDPDQILVSHDETLRESEKRNFNVSKANQKKLRFRVYGERFNRDGKVIGSTVIAACGFFHDAEAICKAWQGNVKGKVWMQELKPAPFRPTPQHEVNIV